MRRNSRGVITRVVLFITMCMVFMFVLVTVFGQFRFDARNTYSAVFTNVSGLKGGNFVRIAGVEVGKVKNMSLHKDGTVTVEFSIDKNLTLTEGTKAARIPFQRIGEGLTPYPFALVFPQDAHERLLIEQLA